jgi:hypothetical protein
MGIIYMLTSPDNKKYIGQTIQGFTKRMYGHKHGKSYCRALRNAINHFGFDTFKKEIIWEGDNCSLCDMEKYYINTYDTLYPNGYNLSSGGGRGEHRSKDTIQLMVNNQREMAKQRNKGLLGFIIENRSKKDGHITSWSFGTYKLRWGGFKTKEDVLNFQNIYTENPENIKKTYLQKRTKNGNGCVYYRKDRKKWCLSKNNKYMGSYETKEEAEKARILLL